MSHQRAKELAIFRTAVAGASRHRPEPVTRGTGGRKPPASRPSPRPFVGGMLALSAGLAAAEEARAEADRVARHAGELSRELAAARADLEAARVEVTSLRARPETAPALDEVLLERIAQRAARKAVALQADAAKLSRLAQEHGGAEAVVRIVDGAMALRKAVG